MSGGHFDYQQYKITYIADEIEEAIKNSSDFYPYGGGGLSNATLAKFEIAVNLLRDAAKMVHRIDWLLSGDDGEETFHKRWNEEIGGME